jgi:hypothetical protein
MGENHFAPLPTALYGAVLLMSGVAYYVLEQIIIRSHQLLADAIYVLVALMWLIPDRRIESLFNETKETDS